ncbi:hypothetical protein, partial [Mycobacterium sp. ACS1612]|uniref:hypothetical protein n=1 Tax=Mycobacterium sp. ACS1612 TaxID=1834117 RepID=UPI003514E33A
PDPPPAEPAPSDETTAAETTTPEEPTTGAYDQSAGTIETQTPSTPAPAMNPALRNFLCALGLC